MRIGYLGLGSNVGDRRSHLQAAIEGLWSHGIQVLRSSSVYETEPVEVDGEQPEYLNACVHVETPLTPLAALAGCKALEVTLGRELGAGYVHHGPRPIDIDILVLGDEPYEADGLQIPHPRLTSRRFVLVPLLELAPDLIIPGDGAAVAALADLGPGQAVRRAGPPLDVRA
jgi:2-amino-4-hydroxy-6-hydroxymethyldihydropteridine diphosphokinase